ncbi:hypothetical protein [Rosistilla oblonga]|uniref:hypothetical protein n=1 Tax=Rosistilla oblonga TaxID=2527990 RepID=UPI003A9692A7
MTPTDFTDVILGLLHRFEAASIKTPAAVVDESPLQAIGKSARETLTVLAFITVRLFERISLSFPPGIENFLAPTDIIPIRRVVKTTTPQVPGGSAAPPIQIALPPAIAAQTGDLGMFHRSSGRFWHAACVI